MLLSSQKEIYYTFTCVMTVYHVFAVADVRGKELGLLGNCDCDVVLEVRANADESSRYSNTLLVSLNNRIYFRDHPFRGAHGNTRCYVDSGRSFRATVTPLAFAHPRLHHHTQTSIGDNLKLDAVSGTATVDIDIEKTTVVGDSPNPRCALPSRHFGTSRPTLLNYSHSRQG
jgi:hypothetical protein